MPVCSCKSKTWKTGFYQIICCYIAKLFNLGALGKDRRSSEYHTEKLTMINLNQIALDTVLHSNYAINAADKSVSLTLKDRGNTRR